MSILASLRLPPFNLDDDAINWVELQLDRLSLEEKLQQLFVHLTIGDDRREIEALKRHKPGGIHRFVGDRLNEAWNATKLALDQETLPLLVTGDLEAGGHGPHSMTRMPNQMAIAAANDLELSAKAVNVLAREGRALGFNWSFTPVVDLNRNIQSAVVGTRSYGSDLERVIAQATTHIRAMQSAGIAATAKHWPGEGFDQRDQHLVTTINPLSASEWDDTFGRVYRAVFDAGVMTVMSAHIALPTWAAKLGVPEGIERYRPASQSGALNFGLMRDELGFNGLIVSDATGMGGFGAFQKRALAVPDCIAGGCDVLLFSENVDLDMQYLFEGLRSRRLTEDRVEDAVTRVLGLKAALGLHIADRKDRLPSFDETKAVIRCGEHTAIAKEIAERSVTLVKDTASILPISPETHRRVVIISSGTRAHPISGESRQLAEFTEELRRLHFEVHDFDPSSPPTPADTDLILHVLAVESSLLLSRVWIDWVGDMGMDRAMDRFWHDIPVVMISFGHPYHLFDAPRVPTYINAYSTTEDTQRVVAQKLAGQSPFTGENPVDPFSNLPDARY